MPYGKAAGERCIQLSADNYCGLFGKPERPAVCSAFLPEPDVGGSSNEEANQLLGWLEQQTSVAS
jgi:hypothetical protein